MLKHLVLALAIGATAGFDDPVFGEVATTVSKEWVSITSSTDGVKIAAVVDYGNVWVSTDSGSNFHEVKTTPPKRWTAIVSSWDGVRLAATTRDRLWRSTDSGMNWYEVEEWAGILRDDGYFTGITASHFHRADFRGRVAATPRLPRGYSVDTTTPRRGRERDDVADGSRRRRGCRVDIP